MKNSQEDLFSSPIVGWPPVSWHHRRVIHLASSLQSSQSLISQDIYALYLLCITSHRSLYTEGRERILKHLTSQISVTCCDLRIRNIFNGVVLNRVNGWLHLLLTNICCSVFDKVILKPSRINTVTSKHMTKRATGG